MSNQKLRLAAIQALLVLKKIQAMSAEEEAAAENLEEALAEQQSDLLTDERINLIATAYADIDGGIPPHQWINFARACIKRAQ